MTRRRYWVLLVAGLVGLVLGGAAAVFYTIDRSEADQLASISSMFVGVLGLIVSVATVFVGARRDGSGAGAVAGSSHQGGRDGGGPAPDPGSKYTVYQYGTDTSVTGDGATATVTYGSRRRWSRRRTVTRG